MKFWLWPKRLRMTQGVQKSPRNWPPMKIQLLLTFAEATKNLENMNIEAPRNPTELGIWWLVIWVRFWFWIWIWIWTWTWIRFLSERSEPRLSVESGIEQLSWIIGLDIQNSLARHKWESIGKIDFPSINTSEGLIIKDQALVKHYLESINGLKYLFSHFTSGMNPFLVNIILFSTDTWSEVDLQSLKELEWINNIQDFCIKAFDFKYGFQDWSYLSEGFYMSHLLRSLRYFETRNVSATYLPLKLKVIESDSLNREEISWVKNLKMKFFHDICQVVKCSKEDIEMAIAVQSGQLALRHKLMYSYFGMMKERFQRLIEECLELNIQGGCYWTAQVTQVIKG